MFVKIHELFSSAMQSVKLRLRILRGGAIRLRISVTVCNIFLRRLYHAFSSLKGKYEGTCAGFLSEILY